MVQSAPELGAPRALRILLVGDDASSARHLTACLESEGFLVDWASSGWEGLGRAVTDPVDLVILDVQIPDLSRLDLCRRVRRARPELPLIVLSAQADEDDQIAGWKLGVDDYVTKPISPRLLAMRTKALLRRRPALLPPGDLLQCGPVEIDQVRCTVRLHGEPVVVTPREYGLLLFLARHPHRVFTRKELYEQVWGERYVQDDNTVAVFVRRLREKLEADPAHPQLIVTTRGMGYSFEGGSEGEFRDSVRLPNLLRTRHR